MFLTDWCYIDQDGRDGGILYDWELEHIVIDAIQTTSKSGVKSLTFGAGANAQLTLGHHMKGAEVRILQHTYEVVAKQFHPARKSEFLMKLGAHEEPLYIAYPPHESGSRGICAIMNFFKYCFASFLFLFLLPMLAALREYNHWNWIHIRKPKCNLPKAEITIVC